MSNPVRLDSETIWDRLGTAARSSVANSAGVGGRDTKIQQSRWRRLPAQQKILLDRYIQKMQDDSIKTGRPLMNPSSHLTSNPTVTCPKCGRKIEYPRVIGSKEMVLQIHYQLDCPATSHMRIRDKKGSNPASHLNDNNILRRALIKELDAINDYDQAEVSLDSRDAVSVVKHINKEEHEHAEELSGVLKKLRGNPMKPLKYDREDFRSERERLEQKLSDLYDKGMFLGMSQEMLDAIKILEKRIERLNRSTLNNPPGPTAQYGSQVTYRGYRIVPVFSWQARSGKVYNIHDYKNDFVIGSYATISDGKRAVDRIWESRTKKNPVRRRISRSTDNRMALFRMGIHV